MGLPRAARRLRSGPSRASGSLPGKSKVSFRIPPEVGLYPLGLISGPRSPFQSPVCGLRCLKGVSDDPELSLSFTSLCSSFLSPLWLSESGVLQFWLNPAVRPLPSMRGVRPMCSTVVCPLRLRVPASNSHVRPLPFAGFGVLPRYLYAPLHFNTPALFYNTKSLVLIQSCYLGSFWIWEGFVCCEHSGRRSSFSFSVLPDSSAETLPSATEQG